jgi:Flp pilus assembly protein TadG
MTLYTSGTLAPVLCGGTYKTAEGRLRFSPACRGRRRGREDGQATLEMVVSLTVIFSLVFWLFELCMFTYTCSVLNDAAQEG